MRVVIYGWTAKRSGGRITIHHVAGKIANIDEIRLDQYSGAIVATAADGKRYELSMEKPPR